MHLCQPSAQVSRTEVSTGVRAHATTYGPIVTQFVTHILHMAVGLCARTAGDRASRGACVTRPPASPLRCRLHRLHR